MKTLRRFFVTGTIIFFFSQGFMYSQVQSSRERIDTNENPGLTLGGYGEVSYAQSLDKQIPANGTVDVKRFVLLMNQRFNERVSFFTEIEFEHVKEVYVEQAFLQYSVAPWLQFRGGLLLIPFGIINIAHEPTTFNGVERPMIDKVLAPTTWREVGIGLSGNLIGPSVKYEVYATNGLKGYDEKPLFSGTGGLRKGRQKGAEAIMRSPDISGRIEYYGVRGLTLGMSGYGGRSESNLYNTVSPNDEDAVTTADSSTTRVLAGAFDFRYQKKWLQLRGEAYYFSLPDAGTYNRFSELRGSQPSLGQTMTGFYAEIGGDLFHGDLSGKRGSLVPFVRYSSYNTHQRVPEGSVQNPGFRHNVITTGLGWKPVPGAVFKADMQWDKSGNDPAASVTFRAGIGVTF